MRNSKARSDPTLAQLNDLVRLARQPSLESRRLLRQAVAGYKQLADGDRLGAARKASVLDRLADAAFLLAAQETGDRERLTRRLLVDALRMHAGLVQSRGDGIAAVRASFRLGNALLELAAIEEDRAARPLRDEARAAFSSGLQQPNLTDTAYAMLFDGVGRACRDQAMNLGGEESYQRVCESEKAFRHALRLASDDSEQVATTQINLAGALGCKSEHLTGDARRRCLSQACTLFRKVLAYYRGRESAEDVALAQHNLASVLVDQARQLDGLQRRKALQEAEMLYRDVLHVHTVAAAPGAHAGTLGCLSQVLLEQAVESTKAEAMELLSRAEVLARRADAVLGDDGAGDIAPSIHQLRIVCERARLEDDATARIAVLKDALGMINILAKRLDVEAGPDTAAEMELAFAQAEVYYAAFASGALGRETAARALDRLARVLEHYDERTGALQRAEALVLAGQAMQCSAQSPWGPYSLPRHAVEEALRILNEGGYEVRARAAVHVMENMSDP